MVKSYIDIILQVYMLTYTTSKFLKHLQTPLIQESNRFINQYPIDISSSSNNKSEHPQKVEQSSKILEIGTRFYELLCQEHNYEELEDILNKLMPECKQYPQAIKKFFDKYPNVSYQLALSILNCVSSSALIITPHSISNLLQFYDQMAFQLSHPQVFQIYLRIVFFWVEKYYLDCQGKANLGVIQKLTERLQIVEQKFVIVKGEFEISSKIFWIAFSLFIDIHFKQKFQNFIEMNLQTSLSDHQSSPFKSSIRCIQIQSPSSTEEQIQQRETKQLDRLYEKYLDILMRYCLIDPQNHLSLLRMLFFVLQQPISNKSSQKRIIQYFETIVSLMNKKIFPDYEQRVLSELLTIAQRQQNIGILKEMFKSIPPLPNQILLPQIVTLKELFIFKKLQNSLFNLVYESINCTESPDKECIKLFVEWNLELMIIPTEELTEMLSQRKFQGVSKSTQEIISASKSEMAGQLLESILKAKVEANSPNKKHLHKQFLKQEVLHKNPKPYIVYTSILIHTITNPAVDPQLINIKDIKTIGITNNLGKLQEVRECTKYLFETAIKNDIVDILLFQNMVFLCSLVEGVKILCVDLFQQYFSQLLVKLSVEEVYSMLQMILRVFIITGNKLPVFCILCVILKIQDECIESEQKVVEKALKSLQIQIKDNSYAGIMSYSSQSLKLLLGIYMTSKNRNVLSQITNILIQWSLLFTKNQIEMLLYLYDTTFYSQIISILGLKNFTINFTRKQIFKSAIKLLVTILNNQFCKSNLLYQYYFSIPILNPHRNELQIIPNMLRNRENKLVQNPITLEFFIIVNWKFNRHSFIDFYSMSPIGTDHHRLYFSYHSLNFCDKIAKTTIGSAKIDNNPSKSCILTIKIMEGSFIILCNQQTIMAVQYQNKVENIKCQLNGDILLGNFGWGSKSVQRKINTDFTYSIYPEEAEVRVKNCDGILLKSINKKLSTSHLCAYLKTIFEFNQSIFDRNEYYNQCFSVIISSIDVHQKIVSSSQKAEINKACSLIHYLFHEICQITDSFDSLPVLCLPQQMKEVYHHKLFFTTLIASVFNEGYILKISMKLKMKILQFLEQLLKNNDDFRVNSENRRMGIFVKIFTIYQQIQEKNSETNIQVIEKLEDIAKYIMFTHLPNSLLLEKIKFLLYLSQQPQNHRITDFFDRILSQLFILNCQSEAQTKSQGKLIIKHIIFESKELTLIITSLSFSVQIKTIECLLKNQACLAKCQQIFTQYSQQQFLKFNDWFVCTFKHYCFEFFDCGRQNGHSLDVLVFLLNCLKKTKLLIANVKAEEEEIINDLMKQFFIKISNYNPKSLQILQKIHQVPQNPHLIDILVVELKNIPIHFYSEHPLQKSRKHKNSTQLIQLCFSFILKLPKQYLFRVMCNLRKMSGFSIEILCPIFRLECLKRMKAYSMSIFLQFTIEFLVVVGQYYLQESQQYQIIGQIVSNFLRDICFNTIFINQKELSQISLYNYPKMQSQYSYGNITKLIIKIKSKQYFELTGGIHFKCLCLVARLINMYPKKDFSEFFTFIFQKAHQSPPKTKSKRGILKTFTDIKKPKKEIKERHQLHLLIKNNQHSYYEYYSEHDQQFQPEKPSSLTMIKQSQMRMRNLVTATQSDLSPFFVDYFMMKLCMFLQNWSGSTNKIIQKTVGSYSQLFVRYGSLFEQVFEEMVQKNYEYHLVFESVEQLLKMDEQSEKLINDLVNTPKSPQSMFSVSDFGFNDGKFLSPKKNIIKSSIEAISSAKKKRTELLRHIEKDPKYWINEAKPKKLHRHFRNQSKQILMLELLHSLHTIETCSRPNSEILEAKKKQIQIFLNQYDATFVSSTLNERELKRINDYLRKEQIRKVYPFTCNHFPVYQLKSTGFTNQISSFLELTEVGSYQIRNDQSFKWSVSDEPSMNMLEGTFLTENNVIQKKQFGSVLSSEDVVCVLENKQEDNVKNLCQVSMKKGVYFCEWSIHQNQIVLMSKSQKMSTNKQIQDLMKRGVPPSNINLSEGHKIVIKLQKVAEIFYRKYNQIPDIALEFFLKDGSSLIIILYSSSLVAQFIDICRARSPKFKKIEIIQDFRSQFIGKGFTELWVNGEISNFDYLMAINKYAGRSFADLSQYYVFPWVLTNYTSQQLNLNDQTNYRDLRKPVGALNPQKLKRYKDKLANLSFSSEAGMKQKYLYGSHYSTSLFILYYLVRLQPFTTLHHQMQSGSFDSPDRIFSSIELMWESLMNESNSTDIKQSIPQFYYQPTFLRNNNNLNLGVRSDGVTVGDVELPPWAQKSPERFILIMRAALESDFVSMTLNHWIDLIFGKDQMSFDKDNVYYPYSYIENLDVNTIEHHRLEGVISQIYYYGQNSYALFSQEHPRKKTRLNSDIFSKEIKTCREDQILEKQSYIRKIQKEGCKVILTISTIGNSRDNENQKITLNMSETSLHTLIRKIQNRNTKIQRIKSLNNIFLQDRPEISYETFVDPIIHQVTIKNKTFNYEEIIHKFYVDYSFTKVSVNPVYFVCYGAAGFGLRVYNWELNKILDIEGDDMHVCECETYDQHFFYLTSTGQLYSYNWITMKKNLITQISVKKTRNASMIVYRESKIPKKNTINSWNYKFLLIGDLRHIVILDETYRLSH